MGAILVLGSNSPSGAALCAHASDRGLEVIATSRSPEPHPVFLPYKWKPRSGVTFKQIDINKDLESLGGLLQKHRPKYVFNFASQSMVGQSWNHPEHWMQTNVVAVVGLLELLRKMDFLDRYVHVSTPEAYGPTEGWIKETRHFDPSTPYASSRAAGDMNVVLWTKTYDLPAVITRSANIYGEGQQLYRIIPRALLCCLTGQRLPLQGGGLSERAFIHVDDLSRALMSIAESGNSGEDYHISPHGSILIRDLVRKICDLTNVAFDDVAEVSQDRLGKDQAYLLDSEKLNSELGWKERIDLDEGLRRCSEWVSENLETLRSIPQVYVHKP